HIRRQRLLAGRVERLRRRLHVQDLARRRAAVEEEHVDVDPDQPDQEDAQPQVLSTLARAASASLFSCQDRPAGNGPTPCRGRTLHVTRDPGASNLLTPELPWITPRRGTGKRAGRA